MILYRINIFFFGNNCRKKKENISYYVSMSEIGMVILVDYWFNNKNCIRYDI